MNKKLFKLVAILLIFVLLTSSVLSTTMAKYIASGASDAEARVAKWGVVINTRLDSMFSSTYTSTEGEDVIIRVQAEENVLAPGTGNSLNLTSGITGTPEVAMEVATVAEVTLENWEVDGKYYCPLAFTINGVRRVGTQFIDALEFEKWIEDEIAKSAVQLPPGTDLSKEEKIRLNVSWDWAFEGDDVKDTKLGDADIPATINLSLTQTVVQINEFEEPYKIIDEDTIEFGYYPQSEVEDTTLTATLNAKAGDPSTQEGIQNWTSYRYYSERQQEDYMWYIDVEDGADKYRGVYFTSYRPEITYESAITDLETKDVTYQDDNGYSIGQVYWFKYEPIRWNIIRESDGESLVFCDMIIDSQAYLDQYLSNGGLGGIHAHDYVHSTIRGWLNETFYDTAFNMLQKSFIATSEVMKNTCKTDANCGGNTQDKIFLLPYSEIKNNQWSGNKIQKTVSDYALVQGVETGSVNVEGVDVLYGRWWINYPNSAQAAQIWAIGDDALYYKYNASSTSLGIIPTMWIKL